MIDAESIIIAIDDESGKYHTLPLVPPLAEMNTKLLHKFYLNFLYGYHRDPNRHLKLLTVVSRVDL